MIYHRQVVYLITSPLLKRDYDRFGIQRWHDRGWKVKVFDFTKFLKPEFWVCVGGEQLCYDYYGLKIVEDERSALTLLDSLDEGMIFIDYLFWSSAEQKIRKVARQKGKTIKTIHDSLPGDFYRPTIFSKIQKVLNHPGSLISTIIRKAITPPYYSADYLALGGTAALHNNSKGNHTIIKAHNFDYDFILSDQQSEVERNTEYLIFLDSDEPYHSDYVSLGIKPYATAKNYFPSINAGLSDISEVLGFNVRIAAHPRSDFNNKSIKYSFPILKDQTFELIKQARVVVAHCSASLQWAIIMRKPIILVTTDEINSSSQKQTIDAFANFLGKGVVNMDRIPKDINWNTQLFVDENKYNNFVETYVKQFGTPEKPFWEIVIDRMEKDLFHA